MLFRCLLIAPGQLRRKLNASRGRAYQHDAIMLTSDALSAQTPLVGMDGTNWPITITKKLHHP
jgi:hypothetical protein